MDENVKSFCGSKGKRRKRKRKRRCPAKEEITALYRKLTSGENTRFLPQYLEQNSSRLWQ